MLWFISSYEITFTFERDKTLHVINYLTFLAFIFGWFRDMTYWLYAVHEFIGSFPILILCTCAFPQPCLKSYYIGKSIWHMDR